MSIEAFKIQFKANPIYQKFCLLLNKNPDSIHALCDIPFLPIEFFKTQKISCFNEAIESDIFTSSGTSGTITSKHFVYDINSYLENCKQLFEAHYSKLSDSIFLFLLPSYLEREGSSLVAMAQYFIKQSNSAISGFYLNEYESLTETLNTLKDEKKEVYLIGVSFGLLDYIETNPLLSHNKFTVMETGGMKGRRKELTRQELHQIIGNFFKSENIHSEYGMTELFSQAYSSSKGIFNQNHKLKTLVRELKDPLTVKTEGKGGINIIDLANIDSCCFIATSDQGSVFNNQFEIIGRIDNSDIRGCNLMVL